MRRLVLAALCLTLSRAAVAEPTEAEKDAARILFTEGKELRDAGKVDAALDRFKRAYELAATPITTVEFARTHAMLGHLLEARRLYRSVEALESKAGESAKSVAAREEAKQLAAALDARIPTLVIRSTAPVTLDGKPADANVAIAVDPGKHVVAAAGKSVEVTLAEGERDRLVTIEAAIVEPKIVSKPVVAKPAGDEAPPSRTPATLRWVGGVAGGVGLLVGAGAGALALSSASAVRDGCAGGVCPPSRHDDLDATRRWATISTIGFGLAAVGATLFVIGFSTEPTKKDVASPSIVPYASLGGIGFTGRF